ncbi:MAG: hypothetical protein AAF224_01795 [Pseudomonadota bacterium]
MNAPIAPPARHWTKESIAALAAFFDLPNRPDMQDWPFEVADCSRLPEFLEALERFDDPDIRFTLLDIVIQSFEEGEIGLSTDKEWRWIENYLNGNFELHAYQIWYWSSFDASIADAWRVSTRMRTIWTAHSP